MVKQLICFIIDVLKRQRAPAQRCTVEYVLYYIENSSLFTMKNKY